MLFVGDAAEDAALDADDGDDDGCLWPSAVFCM